MCKCGSTRCWKKSKSSYIVGIRTCGEDKHSHDWCPQAWGRRLGHPVLAVVPPGCPCAARRSRSTGRWQGSGRGEKRRL